jgi:hypothetical protein
MLEPQTIYAGDTPLASTLVVEQTGPMQLTVRAGEFTTTGDVNAQIPSQTLVYAGDFPYVLSSDPTLDKAYTFELGTLNGAPDILCRSQLDGEVLPAAPVGWVHVHWLVEGKVPAGTTDLAPCALRVFTVLPGFPVGTTAADWQFQMGRV